MTPESAGIEHRQTEEIRLDGRTLRGVVMPYTARLRMTGRSCLRPALSACVHHSA